MKFITAVVFLVILVVTVPATPHVDRKGDSKVCKEKFPNISEPLKTFKATGEASEDLKCFMSCVMEDKEIIYSNGTIRGKPESGPKEGPASALMSAIAPCFDLTPKSTLCETAYMHIKCLWDNDPEKMFIRLFE